MRRPEWAAAGTFAQAWRTAEEAARASRIEWHRELNGVVLAGLARAHVITIGAEQVAALPESFEDYESSAAAFMGVRLPFDPLYISTGGVRLTRFDGECLLSGALVGTRPELGSGPTVFPVTELPPGDRRPYCSSAFQLIDSWVNAGRASDGAPRWRGMSMMEHVVEGMGGVLPPHISEKDYEDGKTLKADCAELVSAVLYLLESANIDLVDAEATRQERRAAHRRGGRVALTVEVRQPRRRPRAGNDPSRIEFSHRFEVRGHYKHFPVGTRTADARPDKLVSHPTLGRCRRIWCPPFVKGPTDRPLIPKVRVIA